MDECLREFHCVASQTQIYPLLATGRPRTRHSSGRLISAGLLLHIHINVGGLKLCLCLTHMQSPTQSSTTRERENSVLDTCSSIASAIPSSRQRDPDSLDARDQTDSDDLLLTTEPSGQLYILSDVRTDRLSRAIVSVEKYCVRAQAVPQFADRRLRNIICESHANLFRNRQSI